jgi:ribonuclease J
MVRILPLGGLGEIGMNCLAIEQRGEVVLVDCGVTFDDRGLGIDVIHPDFRALEAFRDRIKGVIITHGHEDHIGALPYFLRRFDVPVYGPPYALGLVRERLAEHEVLAHAHLIETTPREKFALGSFTIEPIRVTHSIADACALAITTDAGMVVHTGDFKFDETPSDGEAFDVERLSELGDRGVSLMLSDSTNIDADGVSGSEHGVGEAIEPLVRDAKGAVVVALFASNVHRLRMLGDIARRTNRKLVLLGRSVQTHSRVAHSTGYLDWPSDLVFPMERARELPRDKVLGIATGTQAEANAALARLARGEHPAIDLSSGDMIILSSRVIPGHEPSVYSLMGDLLRRGITLHSRADDRKIHVSGHAHRAEQRRMLELVRPRAFIPVHGTLHHLHRHAELAREMNVASVCVIEDGDVATLDANGVNKTDRVHAGRVHTFATRAVAPIVIKERSSLAAEGIAFAVVMLDAMGDVIGDVKIETRGVVDRELENSLIDDAAREAKSAVRGLSREAKLEDARVIEATRLAIRRSFMKALGFKPHAIVVVRRGGGS